MTPAVTKAAKVRRTPAFIRPQGYGNFRNARAQLFRLDDEFGSEFHSRAAHIHLIKNGAGKSPHPAMAVPDSRTEEKIQQRRKPRIADIFVVPGHGTRPNPSPKTIAHHHVVAFAPLLQEMRNLGEVIAIVGVAHDDKAAPRRPDALSQGGSVALLFNPYDPSSSCFRNLDRSVR